MERHYRCTCLFHALRKTAVLGSTHSEVFASLDRLLFVTWTGSPDWHFSGECLLPKIFKSRRVQLIIICLRKQGHVHPKQSKETFHLNLTKTLWNHCQSIAMVLCIRRPSLKRSCRVNCLRKRNLPNASPKNASLSYLQGVKRLLEH